MPRRMGHTATLWLLARCSSIAKRVSTEHDQGRLGTGSERQRQAGSERREESERVERIVGEQNKRRGQKLSVELAGGRSAAKSG